MVIIHKTLLLSLYCLTNHVKLLTGYCAKSLLKRFQLQPIRYNNLKIKMSLLESISESCSLALSQSVKFEPTLGGGASGGGGATTMAVKDLLTGTKYFVKTAPMSPMLFGEYTGVKEMYDTSTIRVPRPITFGEYKQLNKSGISFVVFEYLEFTSGGNEYELGKQLAMVGAGASPYKSF